MSSEEIIRKAYYNPEVGFTGVTKLYKYLHKQGHTSISIGDIKRFIRKQEIHQISKKNVGKLASFIPPYPLYEFQVDLIYLENKHLNKARYGLVCIDIFTKKGDIELLKRKSAPQVVEAMEKLIQRMGTPEIIFSDEGSEFDNAEFRKLLSKYGIEQVMTLGHATVVERFNRTIKELLYKYLQSTDSKTITVVLPKILSNYNNSFHRTIGMSPNEVNEKTQEEAFDNIVNHATKRIRETISVGDSVRVRLKRKSFDKGYKPKYSKQVYKVDRIDGRFYFIHGLTRKYLRAYLEKIGNIEKNVEKPQLEGTMEGHLKNLSKTPVTENSVNEKESLERERALNPIALRKEPRKKRSIPPPRSEIVEKSIPVPQKDYTSEISSLIGRLFPE